MYPFIRFAKEMRKARRAPALGLLETHLSHHIIWLQDLDPWWELNNGRTLTLFDLGRAPLAARVGLSRTVTEAGWRMTVAGNTIRYRHRVPPFQRIEMRSRVVGWDRRFIYMEQSMWLPGGDCANQALHRIAVAGPAGLIDPGEAAAKLSHDRSPDLPDWVLAWIEAEGTRVWPPEH